MFIVIDANIIISALLGGSARFILLKTDYQFITTEYTIREVEKYLYLVENKLKVSHEKIRLALATMSIKVFPDDFYHETYDKANLLIKEIDPKDADVLALALKLNVYLWSEDRHFDQVKDQIRLIKTKDLI